VNRDELLKKLTILDFMATDLCLYLDTHPEDLEAISQYNRIIAEADEVRCKYENCYGGLCSYRSGSSGRCWNWIEDPWPWCEEFNFKICERWN